MSLSPTLRVTRADRILDRSQHLGTFDAPARQLHLRGVLRHGRDAVIRREGDERVAKANSVVDEVEKRADLPVNASVMSIASWL